MQVSSLIYVCGALISIGIPWLITFSIPNGEADNYTDSITLLVSLMLSNSISDLFHSAVEGMFLCILDRSEERPYHLSDKLEKLIKKL